MESADQRFGQQCASTCCVKIATQLLSTTPSPVATTGASLDGGAAFQGVLTAAAAKGTNNNDVAQVKGKSQTQDAKSQVPETRKKSVASGSTVAENSMRDVAASQQLPSDAEIQFASSLPPTPAAPTLPSNQTLNDVHAGAELTGGSGSQQSTTNPLSPVVQVPTNTSAIRWSNQQFNESPASAGPSITTHELPVIGGVERPYSNANPSHSEPFTPQVAAGQSFQSQGAIPSATVNSAPVTPVLPAPIADGQVSTTNTASSQPVAASPVDSPAPVVAAESVPAAPLTVISGVAPLPVAAAGNVSASPAEAVHAALTEIPSATKLPVTSVPVPPVAASIPNAPAKTASASPIIASPVGGERNVAAPRIAASQSVASAPVAVAKTNPASSTAATKVGPNLPEAATPIASVQPILQSVALKAGSTDQSASISSATDISNLSPANPVVDSTQLAAQQTVAAVVQSIEAPVSLPGIGFVNEAQTTSAIASNQTTIAARVGDNAKEVSSRQTAFMVKSKPGSGTSASGNKFDDGSNTNTQAQSESTATSSSVAKAPESSGVMNQGASDSKSFDIASLQQTAPAAGTNHPSQSSPNLIASGGATAQTVPQQPVPDSQPMQGVSSAQLIQSVRSSEMKLGMQSAEFGNISISTSLNHQALSAQISIDHSELGRALAVHLPAIEEKLGSAYGVQARVELRESNNQSSSSDSGYSNSGQQSREQRQSQGSGSTASRGATFERIAARARFTPVSTTATVSRLDIRV